MGSEPDGFQNPGCAAAKGSLAILSFDGLNSLPSQVFRCR
jgi:hypothetical protein